MPSLEGQDQRLDESNYKLRKNAIQKCALVAKERGYKVFALQDDGKCLGSSTAHKTLFRTAGSPRRCNGSGRGGIGVNHVYVIGEMKSMTHLCFNSLNK